MTDKEYVKIYCCADCVHYDMKKHRCRIGAKDEGTGREHFYRDCRLGIHNENESVPIEVLQEILLEIADIDGYEDRYSMLHDRPSLVKKVRNDCLEIIDKHIKEIEE